MSETRQVVAFDDDNFACSRRNWATSYYDTEDGICVHVDGGILKKETAAQEIAKQFPLLKSFWTYKVVETDRGICQTLSKTTGFNGSGDAVGSRNSCSNQFLSEATLCKVFNIALLFSLFSALELEFRVHCKSDVRFKRKMAGPRLLYSGEKILYKEKYEYAIFSGKIDSFGITVGHIGGGNSIEIHDARDEHVVAEIVARIEGTIKEQDAEYTADISFLKMNSYCIAKNLLRCTDRSTGTTVGEHRLVLHKGSISAGELVMIFDEQGYMKQGKIKSSLFNWKCNETMKEIINALSIVDENNSAIAQHGQSGALVTSLPQSESDVLRVYGIVTHTVEYEDATSVTIANRLWDVLRAHHDNGQHPSLGDTPESIDFAQD